MINLVIQKFYMEGHLHLYETLFLIKSGNPEHQKNRVARACIIQKSKLL